MTTVVDALRLRAIMGRDNWSTPQPFGPDGWQMTNRRSSSIIVTCSEQDDGHEWVHASIAHIDRTPTYHELVLLHRAAFDGLWAYQVFAPPDAHVNIHPYALHLWGRLDGSNVLPAFGALRTI